VKNELLSIKDISAALGIPIATVRYRVEVMEMKPVKIVREGKWMAHVYSKTQFEHIKAWFEINGHKKTIKKQRELEQYYCIESCCMIVESKMNLG
jgi:hypothetical protein